MSGQPCQIHPWLVNPTWIAFIFLVGACIGFYWGGAYAIWLKSMVTAMFDRWWKP